MKSYRVISTCLKDGNIHVVKEIEEDDGSTTLNLHAFPQEALEWKMAEKNSSDHDDLIDEILSEPLGGKSKIKNEKLENPKARLQEAGVHQDYVDGTDNEHYEFIKRNSHIHPETLALKQKIISIMKQPENGEDGADNDLHARRVSGLEQIIARQEILKQKNRLDNES